MNWTTSFQVVNQTGGAVSQTVSLAITILVVAGAIGYGRLLPRLLALRHVLKHRTKGLAAIIIDGWIVSTALFFALYLFVLLRTLGVLESGDYGLDAIRLLLALMASVAPLVSNWQMDRWHAEQRASKTEPIAETAAKIVATPAEREGNP